MNCAIVISSYGKYYDLLENNFTLFSKYWTNCPYNIYLSAEAQEFKFDKVQYKQIFNKTDENWGKKTLTALYEIEEEFVILLLDDYYIESAVNDQMIAYFLSVMSHDKNIASICFDEMPFENEKSKYENLDKRKKISKYKYSLQAGVWRKDYLIKNIRESYIPWDFELIGNVRSYFDKYDFYCLSKGTPRPIDYNHGRLVTQGAFCFEEIERFKKNYHFDFAESRPILKYEQCLKQLSVYKKVIRKLRIWLKQLVEVITMLCGL